MKIITGNLDNSSTERNGWFIGHFVDDVENFNTKDFEVKWSYHKKGEFQRSTLNKTAKTICVLISGRAIFEFPKDDKKIKLEKQGDFVFWDSAMPYIFRSIEDSKLLTIRWPSIPNDQRLDDD
mgnify:CR=1 FL=1